MSTIVLWWFAGAFTLVVPYLLGHFFLFCNTFRVGGERSLIWVAMFLANACFWLQTQGLAIPLVIQQIVTLALIVNCLLSKNYHGISCAEINPGGYRKGALSEGAFTRRVLLACRLPRPIVETLVGRRLDEFEPESQENGPPAA